MLASAVQSAWLQRLEAEHENLRASLDWSLTAGEASKALRLCGALSRFWWTRGHFAESREWCVNGYWQWQRLRANFRNERRYLTVQVDLPYFQADYASA